MRPPTDRIAAALGWIARILLVVYTAGEMLDPNWAALGIVAGLVMLDAHILRWLNLQDRR